MANLITRDQLLTAAKLRIDKVQLDADTFVYVKEWTGKQKETWERSLVNEQKILNEQTKRKGSNAMQAVRAGVSLDDFKAKIAVMSICDAEGHLLLLPDDAKNLNKAIKASWLEKIVDRAQRLNGITEQDKEEMVKN